MAVVFEGFRLDRRSRDMLVAARVVCQAPLTITQGSYNNSVGASAGTHSGGGALDLRAKDLTSAQRKEAVNILRKVGFAAWLRTPSQGDWPYHIHCVAVGCSDLSSAAERQVNAYKAGRNGLASNRSDDGPRTWVGWTWEKYRATYPDLLTEDELSAADVTKILNAIADTKAYVEERTQAYAAFDAKNTEQQLRTLFTNLETLEQKYAVAVNEFSRQDGDLGEKAILDGVAAQGTSLASQITALSQQVAALAAKVEALPKA
jgi:hypothetical protein